MHKLRENIEKELKSIEEKGLSQSNIDNAYKLIEMQKGLDKIDMMESGEYSNDGYSRDREDYSNRGRYSRDGGYSNDYDNDNSYRRGRSERTGRYVHRPNYSRLSGDDEDMERYRERKKEYSNSRDEGSKEKMLVALDDFMSGVCGMMKQLTKDADCREEREVIQSWCRKIAEI